MLNISRLPVSLVVFAIAFLIPRSALAVNSVGDLKNVEKRVQEVVDKALPCTVCVMAARGGGSGSGVTVSKDGLVLTAAHVTQGAGEDLFVVFPDGRKVKAKSLGAYGVRDAGMVQITEPGAYPYVELGASRKLQGNDWCVSLGHAGGFQAERTPPVRLGRVLDNGLFVVTDCTIIAGDSGGPLFDLEGRVIGIHSNIGESLSQNQHVPIDVYTENWDRLKKGDIWGGRQQLDPRQLIMGVQLSPQVNDDGVIVAGVTPNAPAEEAGIEAGDVISKINGKEMKTPADIVAVVKGKRPGERLQMLVRRGDETKELELRLIRAGQLMQRGRQPRGRRPGRRGRPPMEDESDTDEERSAKENAPRGSDAKPKDEKQRAEGEEQADEKSVAEAPSIKDADDGAKSRSTDELMREARRNGGRLELTPDERQRLAEFMQDQIRKGTGQLRQDWRRPTNDTDDWFAKVMQAYEPVVAIASDSTYRVISDGKQVALGTAVTNRTLLTKASEINELDFEIEIDDGKRLRAEVLKVFKSYDLALVQISESSLKPIKLTASDKEMPLGTFLASVGFSKEPSAIGLISVKPRELASASGFLGVSLEKTKEGIVIRDVLRRSPAQAAGLQVDDVILKLNQSGYDDLPKLIKAVGACGPDQEIKLNVRRNEEELEITATLGVRMADPRSRIERMNRMGSELSDTRSGFPLALQHDSPIAPNACGGPLVNLDGEVVGINIARAGRIKSYALPAYVIQELLAAVKADEQPAN